MAGCLRITALLAAMLAGGSAADAAGTRACQPFTVVSAPDGRDVGFADRDGDGRVSVGDIRSGRRLLQEEDGAPAGVRYWIATVDAVDGEGSVVARTVVSTQVFADGALFAIGTADETRLAYADTTAEALPDSGRVTATIVGGTGEFAGARGTLDIVRDGARRLYYVRLTCD